MSSNAENLAKLLVSKYETQHGRNPRFESGLGYDMKSSGRFIEIKSRNEDIPKSFGFFISSNQYKLLKTRKNFYIYIVYNLKSGKKPKLKILSKKNDFKCDKSIHYRIRCRKNEWSKIKIVNL